MKMTQSITSFPSRDELDATTTTVKFGVCGNEGKEVELEGFNLRYLPPFDDKSKVRFSCTLKNSPNPNVDGLVVDYNYDDHAGTATSIIRNW